MENIISFSLLIIIMGVVYAIAYRRGKIDKRELQNMEYPELTPNEEEKLRKYYKFCKIFDKIMTEDDFFSGNIAKSSRTDTNKDELK